MTPRQVLRRAMGHLPPRLFLLSRPASSGALYLTFDDGPDPTHTPPLLDQLSRLGMRATFFLIGQRAARHPDIVRRMVAEGHAVGHHSMTHSAHQTTSAAKLLTEALRTRSLLDPVLGRPAQLFRPPFGKLTVAKSLSLWVSGHTIVLWNKDPKDFGLRNAQPLIEWFETEPLVAGDILLLHDTAPWAEAALPSLAQRAHADGLTFRSLWES